MQEVDVVVVGAGIQGTAVAQAVTARGWSVLLLEQYDRVAQGTSSRSSKLIHGGLRYLETGQFTLVRECLRERRWLLRNAPDLVKLVPFHIPIYASTRRRPWQIRAGLSLYSLLSGFRSQGRFVSIPRREWDGLDGLESNRLQAVYQYYDGQTDDAALTAAVAASAKTLGAQVSMSSRLLGAQLDGQSVTVEFQRGSEQASCQAKVLINAAGPWINHVLACVQPTVEPMPIELVQGTHIVLPTTTQRGIYYVESPRDGRAVFVMPWKDQTLVGTTETPYHGDPAKVSPLPQEITYLLEAYAHYFPKRSWAPDDVVESFAGLRVLPAGSGSAFSRPRDTRLHTDRSTRPRVLSIYGGKLTAYRAMAQKVVRQIAPSLPSPSQPKADTRQLRLQAPG